MKRFSNSIILKVCGILALSLILTIVATIVAIMPNVREEVVSITHDYMRDLAKYTGYHLEDLTRESSDTLDADTYKSIFKGVKVHNKDSSYIYVVDYNGTILYHPDESKIGQAVENLVTKDLVEAINASSSISVSDIIDYEYKGVLKYAAYYNSIETENIIIVTSDKSDILAPTIELEIKAIITSAVSCLVWLCLGGVILYLLVSPVKLLNFELNKLSELDLKDTDSLDKVAKKGDELGGIGISILNLRKSLREVLTVLKDESDSLNSEALSLYDSTNTAIETIQQVGIAINDIATSTNSQAEDTQEASDEVIKMGNLITETTNEVNSLKEKSSRMSEANDNTLKVLDNLNKNNEKTRASIKSIESEILKTNKSVNDIQQAVDIISGIANKTNLLSLNASIEAARAGTAGRGFAVVATEIKQLAEQSKESALVISNIIEKLISESAKTVEEMERVQLAIDTQSNDVKSANDAFDILRNEINSSLDNINSISQISNQLDKGRLNLVNLVHTLSGLAEENAASTEETSASAIEIENMAQNILESTNELKNVSTALNTTINRFKV